MIDDNPYFRIGFLSIAAFAGAITSLAATKWKDLSLAEIVLTLVAGFSFAVFVTPWVASAFFGVSNSDVQALAALTYIFGSGSNILLPLLIRWISRVFGSGEPK